MSQAEPCKHLYLCVETIQQPGFDPGLVNFTLTARCRSCLARLPFPAVQLKEGMILAVVNRNCVEPGK